MLTRLFKEDFYKVYELMKLSFPIDEYRTYDEQRALLEMSEYNIYVSFDESEALAAFIAIWDFETFAFIEHFAVSPAFRNCGLGSKILAEVAGLFKKMLCLEVELPKDELAHRRVAFYQRNHFEYNEYPYVQPSISDGRKPVPLRLMTYGRHISDKEFASIKNTLYTRVYNQH